MNSGLFIAAAGDEQPSLGDKCVEPPPERQRAGNVQQSRQRPERRQPPRQVANRLGTAAGPATLIDHHHLLMQPGHWKLGKIFHHTRVVQ
jgi:hypothetical protein